MEGTLRLEYGKSGNYNNNCLPAEKKKKENTRDRSVPDGSDNHKNWTTLANGEYAPLPLEECLPYMHYQSFPILDCKERC